MWERIRILAGMAALLLPVSAQAAFISASGTFSWTEVLPIGNNFTQSADHFDFDFVSDASGGLLEVERIDVVIGNGLFPDPSMYGGAGYLSWGLAPLVANGGANFSGTGPAYGDFGEGTGAGARDATGYFVGLVAGTGFNFYLDIDQTGDLICPACDIVTPTEFLNGGAFTYTLYFKYNSPGTVVGPASVTFGPGQVDGGAFQTGQGPDALSKWAVRIEIEELEEQSHTPEPGTYALMGCGLIALAMLRRRK